MSERVGGYTGIKPGGARLDSEKVGGYSIGPKPGGMRDLVKGTKPGG